MSNLKNAIESFLSSGTQEGLTESKIELDEIFISEISQNISFSRFAYSKDPENPAEILISSFQDLIYYGSYKTVNIFGNVNNLIQKHDLEFEFDQVSFIPNTQYFLDYKNELIVDSLFSSSNENKEDISKIIANNDLLSIGVPIDTLIIYNKYTLTFFLASSRYDAPYFIVCNGQFINFHSINYALKYPYEEARINFNYVCESSRKRLKTIQDHLDSGEFKDYFEKKILKDKEVMKANKAYFNSSFFERDFNSVKSYLNNSISLSISSEDYLYGDSPELSELVFWGVFDAVFQECENVIQVDSDIQFENSFILMNGLKFSKVHGQGSLYSISIENISLN